MTGRFQKVVCIFWSLSLFLRHPRVFNKLYLRAFRGSIKIINHGGLEFSISKGAFFKGSSVVQGGGKLIIGSGSYVSHFCVIGVNELIKIGENVLIADCVSIRDTSHNFHTLEEPMKFLGYSTAAVHIEDNVWIGHGAVILKGVRIGTGAIIAANSVVNRDVEANTIVGGAPAKVLRKRD